MGRNKARNKRNNKRQTKPSKTNEPLKESQDLIGISLADTVSMALDDNQPNKLISDITVSSSSYVSSRKALWKEWTEFFSRVTFLSYGLFGLSAISLIVMCFTTPLINALTIIVGLVFATLSTFASTFLYQSRFHYRFLLLNESATRFISVLAGFVLGKLIKLGELSDAISSQLALTYFCFFATAFIFYCFSAVFTNKVKTYLGDKNRHICQQGKEIFIEDPVPQEEGFNQKLCVNTNDESWYKLRKELDLATNRNITLFLLFLLAVTCLFTILNFKDIFKMPNVPPVTYEKQQEK